MTPEEIEKKQAAGFLYVCGVLFHPLANGQPITPAVAHQKFYLNHHDLWQAPGYLGQKGHLKAFISAIMGYKGAYQPFQWHPSAEAMLDDYFSHDWSAFVGHGSSGKSRTVAAIAVAEFLMKPEDTSCLLTTTTLSFGKRKVWADVELCWNNACNYFGGEDKMPGELVSSQCLIRYIDRATGYKAENRGLALIPSNEDESESGIGKMKGFKSPRLRLLLDEGSDISYRIVESAKENLITGAMPGPDGRKDFRVAITLNANNRDDTGGKLCMPKGGWDKVDTVTEKTWVSEEDIHVRRFSAWDSPNVVMALAGECGEWDEPWPGLISLGLLKHQARGGETPNFQRQFLAIWPTTGTTETIYSDDEIRMHGGFSRVQRRAKLIARLWGLDPSYAHGGDGCPLVCEDLVVDGDTGHMATEWVKTIWLDEGLDPKKDKSLQIRDKLAVIAEKEGIDWANFGMDVTGSQLKSFIIEKIPGASAMLAITFNAKATDRPVSKLDRTPAVEKYSNLGVELWMVGKELLLSEQVHNLPKTMVEEMCGRKYGDKNGKDPQGRIQIEETSKFKKRLGRSPDEAQGHFICLQVARERHGLLASAKPAKAPKPVPGKIEEADFSRLQPKKGMRGVSLLKGGMGNLSNYPPVN